MQTRLTKCGPLLFTPVFLYLLLQFSLALHHHHTHSYHDDRDYFHGVSTSADNPHGSTEDSLALQHFLSVPPNRPLITASGSGFHVLPSTSAHSNPSQSRAPPTL
ncbi:MAG: hypothetical protein WCP10_01775 [Desulfuromonadales bacterium]